jgi:DNA polymerase-3 subunit alpha
LSFVHLHTHSEYSLLEAGSSIKALASKASEYQMPALALTDQGNLFGAIEFYFACLDKNVKPIIGLDAYLAPGSRFTKGGEGQSRNDFTPPTKLTLLAQNIEGYRTLCRLSTKGYFEGKYYVPRIDEELLASDNAGILCLSGATRGHIYETFLRAGPEEALQKVRWLKSVFSDRFYLELSRLQLPREAEFEAFLKEASKIAEVPMVATNEAFFLGRADKIVQDILVCIGNNRTLHDEGRPRIGTDQCFLKTEEQMRALMSDLPQVCDLSLEIAERCNVKFKLKDDSGKPIYHLPSFPTVDGRSLKEEIEAQAREGMLVRIGEARIRGEEINEDKAAEYEKRLVFELSVIDRMGFNGYFLIVADFINWAKKQDIPVGPGRGSGAGSLVAYSLRITDLDPMPYKLLFERFLNPERISMPDFDIDFCQDRRGEVIRYVTEKYGDESVSQIITYGKLQAKAALKDVGRVLGMTFAEVEESVL